MGRRWYLVATLVGLVTTTIGYQVMLLRLAKYVTAKALLEHLHQRRRTREVLFVASMD